VDINALAKLPALPTLPTLPTLPALGGASAQGPATTFEQMVGQFMQPHAQASQESTKAIEALATGQATDLHTATLAAAQADLSFRLILEIRNRLTEAYQEISRMQV
jgi:flagellar hook-basal body complex protein FliE